MICSPAITSLVSSYPKTDVYPNTDFESSVLPFLQLPPLQIQNGIHEPSDGNVNSNGSDFDVVIRQGAGKPGVLNTFFSPPSLHVNVGDTINWINQDSVAHTVANMAFKSDLILPASLGDDPSIFSHKFDMPGTYAYFCSIHPYMSGIVYVDTQETQRTLVSSTQNETIVDTKIEIPINAAYEPNFGPMFIPSGAHIPFGSKVTWTNQDYVPHTATSPEGLFDTKIINPGDSKSTVLSTRDGTISYYCKIHPWMQATLIVEPLSS